MPAAQAVHIVGLKEFRAKLRDLEGPGPWTRELGKIQRGVATDVAAWARADASGMGGPQRHFAAAIAGRGGVAGARISIADPAANAAFWGAKQRTGWNAGNDTANQPDWVGSGWDVGQAGQGPYAINPAIAAHTDDIVRTYREQLTDLAARAFT